MKGKGKDQVDCPLQFPDFTPTDHTRVCSRYTSALQRGEEEGIGVEDLDVLQLELEGLLVSVTKRRDQLEEEMQILVNWQEKKEKKSGGGGGKAERESTGKRSRLSDGKPTKKYKDGTGKAHSVSNIGRPKSKNVQQTRVHEYEFADSPAEAHAAQKNDAPNRFWASVEPYCAEITQEHIKFLEDMIKSHEEDAEYQKIPPLGKHYSYKWAQKDIEEEKKESAKLSDKRKGLSSNASTNSVDGEKIVKKVENDSDDTSPFGALTQRLVSCLIEENIMTSLEDTMTDSIKVETSDGNASHSHSKGNFIKSLNVGNPAQLEKRLRKELEEQGILDADETEAENPDDELLSELKKTQASLKPVCAYNLSQAKKLLKLAKEEMARQEIRKKLQVIDAEVMDIQRRISIAKQKKKSPVKKEREHAMKILKERESIIKQLQSMGSPYY